MNGHRILCAKSSGKLDSTFAAPIGLACDVLAHVHNQGTLLNIGLHRARLSRARDPKCIYGHPFTPQVSHKTGPDTPEAGS